MRTVKTEYVVKVRGRDMLVTDDREKAMSQYATLTHPSSKVKLVTFLIQRTITEDIIDTK